MHKDQDEGSSSDSDNNSTSDGATSESDDSDSSGFSSEPDGSESSGSELGSHATDGENLEVGFWESLKAILPWTEEGKEVIPRAIGFNPFGPKRRKNAPRDGAADVFLIFCAFNSPLVAKEEHGHQVQMESRWFFFHCCIAWVFARIRRDLIHFAPTEIKICRDTPLGYLINVSTLISPQSLSMILCVSAHVTRHTQHTMPVFQV